MKIALQTVIERVISAARKQSGVEAVYLFGSAVRNRMHPKSDLDLAVLFSNRLSLSRREKSRMKLAQVIEENTALSCDLIDLAEASTWLKYHVLKTGEPLYERSKRKSRRFVAQSFLDYFDFQPVYEGMERRLLEQLKAA